MFLFFKLVEIFDQFIFLLLIYHPNVTFRKLFRIVVHGLIDSLGLYVVQFGDITVEDDLLVAIYLSFLFDCKKKRDKRNALCRCANSG